jgi:hypothetical protein
VFTARYALSPYIKQIRFVFKGLTKEKLATNEEVCLYRSSLSMKFSLGSCMCVLLFCQGFYVAVNVFVFPEFVMC